MAVMIVVVVVFLFMFPAITISSSSSSSSSSTDPLMIELQDASLRLTRLESILEESIVTMDYKNTYIKQQEKRIQDMETMIDYLHSSLFTSKTDSSLQADVTLDTLEGEVRNLWAASRQNNFDLHFLKSKAQDAEDRLESATSQLEKLSDIVTEQWIQIQQLEQALHITEIRVSKAQKQVRSSCAFTKFIDDMSDEYQNLVRFVRQLLFDKESLSSYLVHFQQQLQRLFSEFQKYHHQLQDFVKREMERNELTAPYANKEVVFFVYTVSGCSLHHNSGCLRGGGLELASKKIICVAQLLLAVLYGSCMTPFNNTDSVNGFWAVFGKVGASSAISRLALEWI
ncbi:hypothetical protein ACFE04_020577 [Oxalis oulophora]